MEAGRSVFKLSCRVLRDRVAAGLQPGRVVLSAANFTPNADGFSCAFCLVICLLPRLRDGCSILFAPIPTPFCCPPCWLTEYLDWARARLVPWLSGTLGIEVNLDKQYFRQAVADSLRSDSDIFKTLLPKITTEGMAIVVGFTTVLLMPVVLFYFLRDWQEILRRTEDLIPRRHPGVPALLVAFYHLRAHYVDSDLYKSQ